MFMVRLNSRPFYKQNFDAIILKLSGICAAIRNPGQSSNGQTEAMAESSQNFMRKTTKYWVHPDNVTE